MFNLYYAKGHGAWQERYEAKEDYSNLPVHLQRLLAVHAALDVDRSTKWETVSVTMANGRYTVSCLRNSVGVPMSYYVVHYAKEESC